MDNQNLSGFTIAYEDPDFLIINKDKGIAVQNKTNDAIIDQLSKTYGKDIHLITRLDQPVSGLFIIALNQEAAQKLSLQLTFKSIDKEYVAIVEGKKAKDKDSLSHKLLKVGQKAYVNQEGKECHLSYEKLPSLDKYDVLSIRIASGRFHQIRAQLAAEKLPIKGDLKYGAKRSLKDGGICLHCRGITLLHPKSKEKLSIVGNLPSFDVWKFVES